LLGMSAGDLPRHTEVGLDGRVLAFTLGVSVFTGVLFGLVPAVQASTPDLHTTLKGAGRHVSPGRGRSRGALVVAEVALAVVLLIGAGLLLRSCGACRPWSPASAPTTCSPGACRCRPGTTPTSASRRPSSTTSWPGWRRCPA
ncbi:hypothetical protein ACLESO_37345, partial [Pyxidicoccus sp. 3LG]